MLGSLILSSVLAVSSPTQKDLENKYNNSLDSLNLDIRDIRDIQRSIVEGRVMDYLKRKGDSYETLKSDILDNLQNCPSQINLTDSLIKNIRENYYNCVKRIYKFRDIKDSNTLKYKEYIEKFLRDTDSERAIFFYHITDSQDKDKRNISLLMRLEYKPTEEIYPTVDKKYFVVEIPLRKD